MTGRPIPTYGITADATDPKAGMTLDELAAFVQRCMKLGQPGDTPIRAVLGWGGQIKTIRSQPRPITGADR